MGNKEMKHAHEKETEQYWEEQSPLFRVVYQEGMEQYARERGGLKDAFALSDRCIRCIDEGTPGGVHLAGSGILLGKERAVKTLIEAGAEGVYSHAGCGAAKLFASRNNLDTEMADEYGETWARELAVSLDVPYKGHIAKSQLRRPPELHTARIVYYDGTGELGDAERAGLPRGFVISRRYTDAEYASEEARIAVSIAFGDHGFGEKFTKEEPLIIVPVGDPLHPDFFLERLKDELKGLDDDDRVIVDGFSAPEEAIIKEYKFAAN